MENNDAPKFGPFHEGEGDSVELQDMVGWKIIAVGDTAEITHTWHKNPEPSSTEGGLTFIIERKGVIKKVVLGYTELGLWKYGEEIIQAYP